MFERVRRILAAELDLDPRVITPNTNLRKEYAISSIEYLGALLALDSELEDEDELDTEYLASLRTVGEIARYMEHFR